MRSEPQNKKKGSSEIANQTNSDVLYRVTSNAGKGRGERPDTQRARRVA